MKLQNKIALITGASRGIGKATAMLFAKEGATVIINYVKSEAEAKKVVDQIKSIGGTAHAIQCDVSDEKQVDAMVKEVIKKFGRIDILVNNAGIVFDIPFKERTVAQWKRTLEVNLIGTFLCSKYVSEHMLENGYGRIINVASSNGINVLSPESMDYDASKAALINLTKNLSQQLGPKILVNCVAPGWVDTDMNRNLDKKVIEDQTNRTVLKRMADPAEIAAPMLFLASADASFITGTALVVDGGFA